VLTQNEGGDSLLVRDASLGSYPEWSVESIVNVLGIDSVMDFYGFRLTIQDRIRGY
jgi:hypothetical protein